MKISDEVYLIIYKQLEKKKENRMRMLHLILFFLMRYLISVT